MTTILLLGLLVGMQHAMEVDHLAAVASLATRSNSLGRAARMGAAWGVGHSLTLALFAGIAILLDQAIPERMALMLELAVGAMLILLGIDVVRRVLRERYHFHRHAHGEQWHIHGHSHKPCTPHEADKHVHRHLRDFPFRSLLVGMVHGMAGSAALIILALKSVASPTQGFLYILLFGIGSTLGMALLAAVVSVPIRYSPRGLTWAHNGLKMSVGIVTMGIGALVVYHIIVVEGLLI